MNECERKFRTSIDIHAVMMIHEVAQDCDSRKKRDIE